MAINDLIPEPIIGPSYEDLAESIFGGSSAPRSEESYAANWKEWFPGLSDEQAKWFVENHKQVHADDILRIFTQGGTFEDIQGWLEAGVDFKKLSSEEGAISTAKEMGLTPEQLRYFQKEAKWSVGDIVESGMTGEQLDEFMEFQHDRSYLKQIRGMPVSETDWTRWQAEQRYGKGPEGFARWLEDEARYGTEEDKRRYEEVLAGLKERKEEALAAYDTRTQQAREDIRGSYQAAGAGARASAVSRGLGSSLVTNTLAMGNERALSAALNRYEDERTGARIGLQTGLEGDVLSWQGKSAQPGALGLYGPTLQHSEWLKAWEESQKDATSSWSEALSSFFDPGNVLGMLGGMGGAAAGSVFGGIGAGLGYGLGNSLFSTNRNQQPPQSALMYAFNPYGSGAATIGTGGGGYNPYAGWNLNYA